MGSEAAGGVGMPGPIRVCGMEWEHFTSLEQNRLAMGVRFGDSVGHECE